MTRRVEIRNSSRGDRLLVTAVWCSSFACRLRGMMFRRACPPGEGLVLVLPRASRWDAAIHMAFVGFPLGVAWLDEENIVTATVVARSWRVYLPPSRARYVLESTPELLESVGPGDRLNYSDA
jgi:uncharacterized membrane protein (UPF0127 family)